MNQNPLTSGDVLCRRCCLTLSEHGPHWNCKGYEPKRPFSTWPAEDIAIFQQFWPKFEIPKSEPNLKSATLHERA